MNPQPFRRTKLVSKVRTGPAGHPRVAKIVKDGPKILQSVAQPEIVKDGPKSPQSVAQPEIVKDGPKSPQSVAQPETSNASRILDLATKAMQALEALKNESKDEEALRDAFVAVKALSDRARMQA
jgi:hypothetical protein